MPKAGSRVRVTRQLINGRDGGHVWADRYDRDLTDIFTIQDEITHAIVAQLKVPDSSRGHRSRTLRSCEAGAIQTLKTGWIALARTQMHSMSPVQELPAPWRGLVLVALWPITLLLLAGALAGAMPVRAAESPIKLAVFDFELDDASAAGAAAKSDPAADLARMQAVSAEARRVLAQSGRYMLVDTKGAEVAPEKARSLQNCDGCDAALALKLGAQQSLIGVVTRVAKTEYYASLRITDARTGKVIHEQSAFFTGADDAWASGVRLLIKHGVLSDPN